jgi:hypothetical protein
MAFEAEIEKSFANGTNDAASGSNLAVLTGAVALAELGIPGEDFFEAETPPVISASRATKQIETASTALRAGLGDLKVIMKAVRVFTSGKNRTVRLERNRVHVKIA